MWPQLCPVQVSLLKLTQGKTLKRLYETQHMIQVRTYTKHTTAVGYCTMHRFSIEK